MMKKLIFVLSLLVLSSTSFAFDAGAYVSIDGNRAVAEVYNQWNRPIICTGQIQAIDAFGNVANAWMRNAVIMPGRSGFIYAETYGYNNYFRDARANINCMFR